MEYAEFAALFASVLTENGLAAYIGEAPRFFTLTRHLLDVNRTMNLTALRDERSVVLRHYADSLTLCALLPTNARVIDVGCGAGFPSLPLAICRPDLSVVALDSTEKRVRFVRETAELLGCASLTAEAARAEDAAHTPARRERFDVCTARAVAALPALCELCLPFVRVGGRFLALKSRRAPEELEAAMPALRTLGGDTPTVHTVTLHAPEGDEERLLVEIPKRAPTPAAYPRTWAQIAKRPLGGSAKS